MLEEINALIETNKKYLVENKKIFKKQTDEIIVRDGEYVCPYNFLVCGYAVKIFVAIRVRINALTQEQETLYIVTRAQIDIDNVIWDTDEFMSRMAIYQLLSVLKFLFSVSDRDNFVPKAILDIDNEQKAN